MRQSFASLSEREAREPLPEIKFDVMLGDRWVCTMRMPVTSTDIIEYDGDTPIYDTSRIGQYVEQQRPSLTGKPYNIEFITGKPIFRT